MKIKIENLTTGKSGVVKVENDFKIRLSNIVGKDKIKITVTNENQ